MKARFLSLAFYKKHASIFEIGGKIQNMFLFQNIFLANNSDYSQKFHDFHSNFFMVLRILFPWIFIMDGSFRMSSVTSDHIFSLGLDSSLPKGSIFCFDSSASNIYWIWFSHSGSSSLELTISNSLSSPSSSASHSSLLSFPRN